jgi:hypothetical protein
MWPLALVIVIVLGYVSVCTSRDIMLIAANATPLLPPAMEAQDMAKTSKGKSRRMEALRMGPDMGMSPSNEMRHRFGIKLAPRQTASSSQ